MLTHPAKRKPSFISNQFSVYLASKSIRFHFMNVSAFNITLEIKYPENLENLVLIFA